MLSLVSFLIALSFSLALESKKDPEDSGENKGIFKPNVTLLV